MAFFIASLKLVRPCPVSVDELPLVVLGVVDDAVNPKPPALSALDALKHEEGAASWPMLPSGTCGVGASAAASAGLLASIWTPCGSSLCGCAKKGRCRL